MAVNISNIHTSYIYYFKDLEGIIIVSLKSQFPWVIFSSIGQVHIWGNLKETFSRIIIENAKLKNGFYTMQMRLLKYSLIILNEKLLVFLINNLNWEIFFWKLIHRPKSPALNGWTICKFAIKKLFCFSFKFNETWWSFSTHW